MALIHKGRLFSTYISWQHIRGVSVIPNSLAATAGYIELMSLVAVKIMLIISSMLILFCLIISFSKSLVLDKTDSLSSFSIVIAPLIALTFTFVPPKLLYGPSLLIFHLSLAFLFLKIRQHLCDHHIWQYLFSRQHLNL